MGALKILTTDRGEACMKILKVIMPDGTDGIVYIMNKNNILKGRFGTDIHKFKNINKRDREIIMNYRKRITGNVR